MHEPTPTGFTDAPLADLVSTASSEPLIDDLSASRLGERLRDGDVEALDRLLRASLRIAIDEAIRHRGLGESQATLVRVGARALLEATAAYDPIRHAAFSQYARHAVRRAIRERFPAS